MAGIKAQLKGVERDVDGLEEGQDRFVIADPTYLNMVGGGAHLRTGLCRMKRLLHNFEL